MIDLAHLSPWLFVVAPLTFVLSYTVFGLSGFGSTAIALPILAHFLPVSYVVPLMALLDMVSAAIVGRGGREHLSKTELQWLAPFIVLGYVIGATVLVSVPDRWLRLALGVFTVLIGANSIVNPVLHRVISRWWCVPAGIVGGAASTTFGAGGPIYATFLSGRLRDKNAVRATVSTLISFSAFSRVAIYVVTGLLHLLTLAGAVLASPFAWIGLKIGGHIHLGLTQSQVRRVVGGLLVFIGGSLLVRAFA